MPAKKEVLGLIICMEIVDMPSVELYWNTWPFSTHNFVLTCEVFALGWQFKNGFKRTARPQLNLQDQACDKHIGP